MKLIENIEAEVGGDLVVAAAAGVELATNVANSVDEGPLDIHVDVFAVAPKREPSALDLGEDLP